jgi:hypothetical protein
MPLGRLKHRWEGNIRMDIREMGLEDVDWIYLTQDRDRWRDVLNIMKLRVP